MKRISVFLMLAAGILSADLAMAGSSPSTQRAVAAKSAPTRRTTAAQSDLGFRSISGTVAFVSPQDLDGSFGLGVSADMGRITPKIWLEPNLEFWSNTKETFGAKATLSDVALGARGKYYFDVANSKMRPFAGAGLGVHFLHAKATVTTGSGTFRATSSDTKLGVDLGGGMSTPIGPRDDFRLEGWYGIVSDVNQLAVRVGFSHKIGL